MMYSVGMRPLLNLRMTELVGGRPDGHMYTFKGTMPVLHVSSHSIRALVELKIGYFRIVSLRKTGRPFPDPPNPARVPVEGKMYKLS